MKKLFTLFFALAASVGTMFAESGTCGDNLTWDLTNGVLTISGTGAMYDYGRNNPPFWNSPEYHSSITSIVINNGATSIGSSAFIGCDNLTTVTIPNSVTSIGESAFGGCYSLTSIQIPNGVTSIGDYTFQMCTSLTAVTIPNNVTSIGDGTFSYCRALTSVTIPNSVTYIGNDAFYECTGLTSPVYNEHVFAYMPRTYTEAYSIPEGIKSIAGGAFKYCTGLTSVTIPNSVTIIGDAAFEECRGLLSVDIPNSVTSIGEKAFHMCGYLTTLTIPNSVTSIGMGAFTECRSLTSMTCYAVTPPTLGQYVFFSVDNSIPLYVPAGSINLYKSSDQWNEFTNILPISAEETETTDVKTVTTKNSVYVTWPAVDGAYTYELVIRDKSGNVVCTLVFNAQGQLMSIVFNAPSRDGAPQQTQTAGFAFTITGLEEGTEYNLTITAKDKNGQEIDQKNMSFYTDSPQAIEDIQTDAPQATKVLMDGHIYILRGEHVYDTEGKMVK